MESDQPLAPSRRIKENRWHNAKVDVAPPVAPPLPGQSPTHKMPSGAERIKLEERSEIQGFLKEEGAVADGVRRFLQVVRQKRVTLQNEWDVREAAKKFVKDYAYAVPNADKEYLRGMNLALKVYLGRPEE